MVRGLGSKNKVYRDVPWVQMDKKEEGVTGRFQAVSGEMTPPPLGGGGSYFDDRYWGSSLTMAQKGRNTPF